MPNEYGKLGLYIILSILPIFWTHLAVPENGQSSIELFTACFLRNCIPVLPLKQDMECILKLACPLKLEGTPARGCSLTGREDCCIDENRSAEDVGVAEVHGIRDHAICLCKDTFFVLQN
jgi:hypothetical protein